MSDNPELYTIGRLARRTGLSVHTIRFWSDAGVVPPTERSAGRYRLYDEAALARLDLVRALRELGIGLDDVQAILAREVTVAEVAEVHARLLDAEIRSLRLRRAVLRAIARRGGTTEETLLMHRLARLSAAERQQIIDDFVHGVLDGLPVDDDAAIVAEWMRELPAELPEDPAPEQIAAWVELAELVADGDFRQRVRAIALAAAEGPSVDSALDLRRLVLEEAGRALADDVTPESEQGRAALNGIVDRRLPAAERTRLLAWLETVADPRVERYWQLIAALNGHRPAPSAVPAFAWTIAALRAHG
ncbi:MerR family transcriptional regulator [Microtetraspora sp. NBRC 13810]|uniref:helix-turn-helix domain-containing protein n=1 Tax=Microtetraspora sp. NBRC 13810 TaxID=3030990 RepID=UPI0024A4BDD4|nr:MerR family transcriptional regulator [Microtetraspora sp. NBRC 13810]GLW07972.1 MerR family transcriptional regulator [Microtetraspora sp. NBRC 13810]